MTKKLSAKEMTYLQRSIRTTENLGRFLGFLDYVMRINSLQVPSEGSSSENSSILLGLLREVDIDSSDTTSALSYIGALHESLVHAPELEVELAFETTPAYEQQLAEWFSSAGFGFCFLKISFVPEINAGVRVLSSGKYYDLSIEKTFSTYLASSKDVIEQILRK
jgi:hypothetical protein